MEPLGSRRMELSTMVAIQAIWSFSVVRVESTSVSSFDPIDRIHISSSLLPLIHQICSSSG